MKQDRLLAALRFANSLRFKPLKKKKRRRKSKLKQQCRKSFEVPITKKEKERINISDDIKRFERNALRNGRQYCKFAWDHLPEDVKKRLSEKYPWTFPILTGKSGQGDGKIYWKKQYYIRVWIETKKNKHLLENADKIGWKQFDIDHIVPIAFGYKMGIDPKLIGSLSNLRVIPNKDNLEKNSILSIEAVRLLQSWKYLVKKEWVYNRF